jgi:hypothetical protein
MRPGGAYVVNGFFLAMAIAIAPGVTQGVLPRPVSMNDLTVPQDRLPAGCALSATDSVRLDGNRVRVGLWASLPIPSNPWTGTDRSIIASIRERMDGPPLEPDGPPVDRRAASRYRLGLADGVEEAYAAIYVTQSDSTLVVVYASRYATTKRTFYPSRAAPDHRFQIGPIEAVLSGDGGQCSQAVEAYLKSLAN